jgi:hypothetical protein
MNQRTQAPLRAQGAIEYLLIIGAAILVVAIVVIAITSVLSQGQTQTTTGASDEEDALGGLASLSYITLAGSNYQKTDPIITSITNMWKLNNATTFTDSVGTGTISACGTACPSIVQGISGNALNFTSGNGSFTNPEQFVTIHNLPVPEKGTYSVWFKPAQSGAGYVASFSIYDDTADTFNHWRGNLRINSSNYLIWRIGSWFCPGYLEQTLNTLISKQPVTINKWHLATLVFDYNSFQADFYLDGELQKSEYNGKQCTNEENIVWLGRRKDIPSAEILNFVGAIDEFIIWDRELTPEEIKSIYDNAPNKDN